MHPSSSLSVAILAPQELLPNIQKGIESLGHVVALAKDPSQIGKGVDLSDVDLVFVALTPEIEEIYEQLEELLDHAAATLFDEADNKQAWPAARWGQHLQPKLAKITRRQEPEKLLDAPVVFELPITQQIELEVPPIVAESGPAEETEFAWDFVDLDSTAEEPPTNQSPEAVQAPVFEHLEPAPIFDGGFDFYNDDEPILLGSVSEETVASPIEAEAVKSVAPAELLTPTPEPVTKAASSEGSWDLSSLALVDDDALPSAPPAPAPKPREVVFSGPQWSLEGEQTSEILPEAPTVPSPIHSPETREASQPAALSQEAEQPVLAGEPTLDIPTDIPQLAEASGLVLIGGGPGGPGALVQLMPHLPQGLPVPLVVYQPLPHGREEVFVANLQKRTGLVVQLAAPEQRLAPGTISVLQEGQTVEQTEDGCRIVAGELSDAIAGLGEDSALVVLSGAPGAWVLPAMDAVGVGALLLGQHPKDALDSQTISTLSEIGLETGEPETLGQRLAERWGLSPG